MRHRVCSPVSLKLVSGPNRQSFYSWQLNNLGAPSGVPIFFGGNMLIIVKLNLEDDADMSEVLEELDYEFKHKDIISYALVDVITEE